MGPTCDRCRATEADCARSYPCCDVCTHFAEPEQPLDLTPDLPPRPRQEPTMTTTTDTAVSHDAAVTRARGIADKPIATALRRYDEARNRLLAVLRDYDTKADARREVARLEAQLAEAKAKLRGGGSTGSAFPRRKPCVRQGMRTDLHQRGVANQARGQLHRPGSLTRP